MNIHDKSTLNEVIIGTVTITLRKLMEDGATDQWHNIIKN